MKNWFISNTDLTLDQQIDALKGVITCVREFALWAFLALALVTVAVGVIVNLKFREKFSNYLKIAIACILGFAICFITVILYLQITRLSLKGEINLNFWLWLAFSAFTLASVIACTLLKVFNKKCFKIVSIVLGVLCFAFLTALLCTFNTLEGFEPLGGNALYVPLSIALIILIVTLAFVFDKTASKNDTKSLTYAGICVAIAFALSYVKFFDGPQGSSVTLASMLPIMLYAYLFGAKKGVLVGAVYGILQCLQDPQIYQPLQVLLDYPIAFSALGLAGLFKGRKIFNGNRILGFALGIILAGTLRFTAHLISGYFVFYSFAEWSSSAVLQSSPFLYSLVVNSAVLIDTVIDVIVGALLFSSKSFTLELDRIN